MLIKVQRHWYSDKSTIGVMSIDGVKCCFTLEDKVRDDGVKVEGKTAIPAGEYDVLIDYSNRWKKLMPHILNVPGFEGVRIHGGNRDTDTTGCLLVGMNKGFDEIYNCRTVYNYIFTKLQSAISKNEPCRIWIVNDARL